MDELERLIEVYRGRASSFPNLKVDVLTDVERVRDSRVVPFLLTVLADTEEAEEVRIHVVKQLRSGDGLLVPADRAPVAQALGDVLSDNSTDDLRVEAGLALGEFVDISGVLSRLGDVCFAQDESIDLRYAAFTSVERAGPTPQCVALLRQLATDQTLGGSSRSLLMAWHIE